MVQYDWNFRRIDSSKIRSLTTGTGIAPLTAQLLLCRNIDTPDSASKFLDPKLSDIYDPLMLPDMDKAVARIENAISLKEPILIYSDYDCDGLGGSSILSKILKKLGANVSTHVPDRNKDGYGIRVDRLQAAHQDGVKVVITVDSGITAIEAADFCNSVGISLIITDHHEPKGATYPKAYAVIHPRVPGSRYPKENQNPCGTAVAFKLAWGLARYMSKSAKPTPELREILLESLGPVALGSVADVVDLVDENRTLVKHGLKILEKNPIPGLGALIDISRTEFPIDSTAIGFKIAPRINAASRMGDATRAFKLLTTSDPHEAARIAADLETDNNKRRELQKELTEKARLEVVQVYGADLSLMAPGIVIALEKTPVGLVGILASKLVDDLRRPVLVLSNEHGKIKGSGRTIRGVSLLKCLNRCQEHLATFGGHYMACGLTLKNGHLEAFREAWTKAVAQEAANTVLGQSRLEIDAMLELDSINYDLIEEINRLEPYGAGNPAPLFATKRVFIDDEIKKMGDEEAGHCSFKIRVGPRQTLRGVVFSKPELVKSLETITGSGAFVDIVYRPSVNNWQGRKSIQLECSDIKLTEE